MLQTLTAREHGTLRRAAEILGRYMMSNPILDSPKIARDFLACKLGHEPREIFAVLYLNAQHELIEYVEEFFGTLTSTSVYPRELVKRALKLNAGAVVLAHNHPSGTPEPSASDLALTQAVKQALALVDVRTLDHVVVGGGSVRQFCRARSALTRRGTCATPGIEAIVSELHDLALTAREAGIGITWYEPGELRGLDPTQIEEVMTLEANEYIEPNEAAQIQRQLTLEIDDGASP